MSGIHETRLRTFVGALLALSVALCACWIYWHGFVVEPRLALGAAGLAFLALSGDAFPVRISERTAMSVSAVALMVAVVVLGPNWAAVAAVPSALFVGGRDWLRSAYELGHSVTSVYAAGLVFSCVSKPLLVGSSASPAVIFYGTLISGMALVGVSGAINGAMLKAKYGQPFGKTWEEILKPYLVSDALNALTAGLGTLALMIYGPVAAIVAVAGSIGSQMLVHRSRKHTEENRELRARVESLEGSLATSNTAFAAMIVRDLGRRDGYTDLHAAATAVYAEDLAREMKLDEARVGRVRIAGLLHNIGLFGLPEELLLSTGRPNSIARARLAEHPARGEEALASVPEFREMASWVRWHHERPDGRGYPDKLRGPWIPLEAKILAVAQGYAAAVLDGPRRPGLGAAKARELLVAGAETEFDGTVVRAFLRILDTESEGYRAADDRRFVFPGTVHTDTPTDMPTDTPQQSAPSR